MENSVRINPDKLQRLIDKSGKTCKEVPLGIQYGKNYIAAAKYRKEISVEAVQSLKQLYNFNPRSYVIEDDVDRVLKRRGKQETNKLVTTNNDCSDNDLRTFLKTIDFAITTYLNSTERRGN